MRKLSLLFCLFNIVNLTTCVSFSIYNPHPGKNIILTQDTSTCLSGKTHKQWYAFYGSLSINTLNSATFFPSDEYSYKITEIATEEDAAISFILGLFTTISRKTILIEYCALPGEKQTKKIKPNSEKQEEVANPKVNPDILKKINERLEQIAERQITLQNQLNSSKENPGFVSDRDQDEIISYLTGINNKLKTVEEKQSKMESEIYSIKTGQENRIITNTNNSNTIPTDKNDQVIVIKGNSKVTIQQNEEENKIEYNKSSRLKENNLLASIYFNFNSSLIQLQEKYRMKKIISKFRSSKSILLVGHSDWIGTKEYNYKLSRKRAEAVKRELRNLVGSENIQISNGDSLEYKRGNAKLSESTASWHRRVDIFLVDN